jgi:UV DNA damage endonuclease
MEIHTKRNGTKELVNICDERNLQLGQFKAGKYSNKQIEEIWISNIENLTQVVNRVKQEGISSMRFSSNLLPLMEFNSHLLSSQVLLSNLKLLGKFVKENKIRVSFHPSQFCLLSSNKQDVITNSIQILESHAWIFDQMELDYSPFYAINIHGGTKGNFHILINSINKLLPNNIKSRLTLENDERSYNVKELYQVYEQTGIPIVWDSHHHSFNNANLSDEQALNLAISTWKVKPLTHLSNTDPSLANGSFTDKRKHSDYVHYIPECQRLSNNEDKIDIDWEFKMKNLAIFKAIKDFDIKL